MLKPVFNNRKFNTRLKPGAITEKGHQQKIFITK